MSVCAALVLGGCQTAVEGEPASTAPGPSVVSVSSIKYDPCTDLSPQILSAAGLNPDDPRGTYSAGDGQSMEVGCRWSAPGGVNASFTATLGKSARTVEEYLSNPRFTSTETSLAGRDVVNFETGPPAVCNVAVRIAGGSAIVVVTPTVGDLSRDQSCSAANTIVEAIAPVLP